jgi:hypothetical protein
VSVVVVHPLENVYKQRARRKKHTKKRENIDPIKDKKLKALNGISTEKKEERKKKQKINEYLFFFLSLLNLLVDHGY